MYVPPSSVVLQGGAILHPVAAVEVKHLPQIATNETLRGLANVSAYHIVVSITDGNIRDANGFLSPLMCTKGVDMRQALSHPVAEDVFAR